MTLRNARSASLRAVLVHWAVLTFGDALAEEEGDNSLGAVIPPAADPGLVYTHKVTGLPHVEMVKPAQTPGEADGARTPGQDPKEPKRKCRCFCVICGILRNGTEFRNLSTSSKDTYKCLYPLC